MEKNVVDPATKLKKILIVDDDDLFVELLSDTFTAEGYEVVKASNGLEALDKVRQHLPSYIFLDLILPKIDGIRVCRYLKQDPRSASIPIVILTGIAAEERQSRSLVRRSLISYLQIWVCRKCPVGRLPSTSRRRIPKFRSY